jgi:hypothetical protein
MKRIAIAASLALLCAAAAAQDRPEAVYRRVHAALLAGNADAMLRDSTAARRAEISKLPDRNAVVKLMAAMAPGSYKVNETTFGAGGQSAQLRASGRTQFMGHSGTSHGLINLLREQGQWKVDRIEWSRSGGAPSKPAAPAAAQAAPAPAPPEDAKLRERIEERKRQRAAKRRAEEAAGNCIYKPVMSEDDLAKCRR